jgi:hypothetical protein
MMLASAAIQVFDDHAKQHDISTSNGSKAPPHPASLAIDPTAPFNGAKPRVDYRRGASEILHVLKFGGRCIPRNSTEAVCAALAR